VIKKKGNTNKFYEFSKCVQKRRKKSPSSLTICYHWSKGKLHCLCFPTKNINNFFDTTKNINKNTFRRYWGGGVREVLEVKVDFRYGELFFLFWIKVWRPWVLVLSFSIHKLVMGGMVTLLIPLIWGSLPIRKRTQYCLFRFINREPSEDLYALSLDPHKRNR